MVAITGIAIELQDKTKQGARAITRSLDDIKKSARETATSVDKLDDNFNRLKDELKDTGRSADQAGREFDTLAGKAKRASDATGGMSRNFGALKSAFVAVGTSIVVKQFFDLLDVSTQINNRLKLVTDSTYALGLAQQQLFEVSQKSRVGFDQTVDLYSRLARSSEELGLTQRELVDITETISQAITVSGASAQAADAALMQLGQGIASGTLRGEELNSVLEQTPRLARAIADGIGVSIGQLRALGAEGALTSETVIKAIQSQQGAVRTEFGQTSATLSQSLTVVTNSLTKLVSKIDESAGVSDKLASSFLGIAEGLDTLSDRPQIALQGILGLLTGGATGLYGRAFQATTAIPEPRGEQPPAPGQAGFEIAEAFKTVAVTLKAEAELVREAYVEGLKAQPTTMAIRGGNRPQDPKIALQGPATIDEKVFGKAFDNVVEEVDKALADLQGAFNELLPVIDRLNPGLAKTSKAFEQIFTSAVRGDILTSVATYAATLFSVFSDGEQETDKLANRMRILSEQLRNARVAAGEATDVFLANLPGFEDIRTQLLQPFDFLYESIRERVFDPAFLAARAADLGSEEEARIDAEISAIQLLFRSVSGGLVDVSQEFADALSRSGIEQSDLVNYQRQIRDIFFGGGDIVWEDLATAALSAREEFSGLSDSLTQSAEQAQRLNEVEQAATRLRVNAQEIALRTQLSQEFRRAGSDVFEQRAAYTRFEQAVRQLQYTSRAGGAFTGGGSGAGASTTTATTTATGGGAATRAAQVTTTTTQPLTVDYSGDNLVILKKEIDQWDQLLYGPVIDGTLPLTVDFSANGDHQLKIWKRPLYSYDEILYGPVWDGTKKPEIDFNGSHRLHIWKRKIENYDEMFYGPAYDGREKLSVNFGNRIQITGKYALDDWSDIFRGWLISKNTQEAGFRPLEYNFGTPGFIKITGKTQLSADALISPPTITDFFFLFIDMIPNISAGLNSALTNLPIVPVNVASLIDFDASGISAAINGAVREAIGDRSYDEPQRLGYTSGRF